MLVVCPSCMTKNRIPDDRVNEAPNCGRCQAALLPPTVLSLTEQNFAHYVQNTELPVIVDFWADWCQPCHMMAPHFAQAAHLAPQYRLVKLNTEHAPQISQQFAIRSIPTLVLLKQGREIARQSGVMSASQILQWVKQAWRD